MSPEYLTPEELVSRYRGKISTRTLANWRSGGKGLGPAYFKAGGKVLYPYAAVLAWEAKRLIDVAQSICNAI